MLSHREKGFESGPTRWTGRVMTALAVLFILFDGSIKLIGLEPVAESFARLGYAPEIAPAIGILELACIAFYVIPRTAPLGAILLTGFLGGAIATHTRVGDPLFSHILFPVYVAILAWGGLLAREARLRSLIALREVKAADVSPEDPGQLI